MAKILLAHAYFLRQDPKTWAARMPYAPLGTLYAAAFLRARGHDVALCDVTLARSVSVVDVPLAAAPRYFVLFEDNFNYLSKMCLLRMRAAALAMLERARARGAVTIACGADASDHPERFLAHADWVVHGEGEATLAELVETLERGDDPRALAGLAYLDPTGAVVRTPKRPSLRDLDALPRPAWDLVDVDGYARIWRRHHGTFSLNLVTSRGCPFHCNWCAKPIWGQRYAARSPESVADEVAYLKHELGAEHLWFMDDILGIPKDFFARLGARLTELDARLPFKCLSRPDLILRPGEAAAMARAGAHTVWMGAESGAQSILDAMDKGTTVEQIRDATAALREAGVSAAWFLQFGYPGETLREIDATRALVREVRPDDIGIAVSYPLPGTGFYASVARELGEQRNWYDSADLAMLFAGPFTTAFYRQLHRVVHSEFRRDRAQRRRGPRARLRILLETLRLPAAEWRLARLARARHAPTEATPRRLSRDDAATPSVSA